MELIMLYIFVGLIALMCLAVFWIGAYIGVEAFNGNDLMVATLGAILMIAASAGATYSIYVIYQLTQL